MKKTRNLRYRSEQCDYLHFAVLWNQLSMFFFRSWAINETISSFVTKQLIAVNL